MLCHLRSRLFLVVVTCLALARLVAAQPTTQHPNWNAPVADRLAAIPNLNARLTALEKALDAAKDKTSLSATTARYTLEVFKDALANPKAYEARRPAPRTATTTAAGAPDAATPAPAAQAPPAPPSKLLSAYVSSLSPLAFDLELALKQAEQSAKAIQAGKDPMAGIVGETHLAYRSSLDGVLMPYRIFVPSNYTSKRSWPLVVFLHGMLCDENTFMNSEVMQPLAERLGYLIVSVNGRGPTSNYTKQSGAHQDVFDDIALMQKYYKIDPKRIFLAGHSMGGSGTWNLGLEYRDRFAALAPMAGARTLSDLDAKLVSGKKIPILITCGGKDTGNTCAMAQAGYEKLKAAGYPTKFVEYPDDGHNPVFIDSPPEVFAWFDKYGGNMK
jgi:predicted esterase